MSGNPSSGDKPVFFLPPPEGEVGDYFPLNREKAPDDTFEIGLVLGGTVSAAAYTAGVLDFLIQALDTWTLAKAEGRGPNHKVVLKIVSGTSGGGICAVLLSRILRFAFPHVTPAMSPQQRANNPLYDVWVNQVDIRDMLQTTDLAHGQKASALFCANKIEAVARNAGAWCGAPLGQDPLTPAKRDYVEDLLPVIVTLTNLRGVPYSSDFRGESGRPEYFSQAGDHIRFRVDIRGGGISPGKIAPYEIAISDTQGPNVSPWSSIVAAALGTSAFPVGLPPRVILRDPQHYRYRYAVLDTPAGATPVWLKPSWNLMMPPGATATSPYQFLAVDGGCINNEPIGYVRQWLAGVLGHNERSASLAHRGVLLIDPFADAPGAGVIQDNGLLSTMFGTLGGFISSGRFETADLDLFTAENVYSRFLVNPVRNDTTGQISTGSNAIASSFMMAFGGFLSSSFREHDYFLGRRNCQAFLKKHFVLDQNNSLFKNWTAKEKQDFGGAVPGYLPIIPLTGDGVTKPINQPQWPTGLYHLDGIDNLVETRLKALAENLSDPLLKGQFPPIAWIVKLIVSQLAGSGADKIMDAVKQAIRDKKL